MIANGVMSATTDTAPEALLIRPAVRDDCGLILELIRDLAEFEKLAHEVRATTRLLEETLFRRQPAAEVVIAEWEGETAGFALFFSNYSTFLARPGIYLEDLFVRPAFRGRGIGNALLSHLARQVVERNGGRLDWSVLHWNERAINFYRAIGARPLAEWLPMRLDGDALGRVAGNRE